MLKINRSSYALAQEHLAIGRWSIDLDRGLIIGINGQPLTGRSDEGYVLLRPSPGTRVMAHRVIWEHLNGPIPDGVEINHVNGVKDDNRPSNLELVTHRGNMRHARDTGLMPPPPIGLGGQRAQTECPKHGPSEWRARGTRPGGYCRACNREATARWRATSRR